jgi:hypothetical protein
MPAPEPLVPVSEPSHFVVSMQGANWQVSHKGAVTGPYPDKDEAVAYAVQAAQEATAAGEASEVIVENEHREFETHWRAKDAPLTDVSKFTTDE